VGTAFAQTAFAQTADGGGPPAIYNIGFLAILVGIFYVLLLRPEQKRRREHEQLIGGLKKNDQIVLASGIHGRVHAVADKLLTVEISPKVLVTVNRDAVQAVQKGSAAAEVREKEREKST
jgi:preprotein translocase subunit YajC